MSILSNVVSQIRLESRWLPPVVIDAPFADSPPNPVASAFGNFLKPVIVTTAFGKEYRSAPYGEPGENNWQYVQVAGILAGAVAIYFAFRGKLW